MEDPSRPVTGYPAPNPYPNAYPANPPPTATVYPCITAATSAPAYGYFQQSSHQDAIRRAAHIRRVLSFFTGVVAFFATVTFVTWILLRPQLPTFRVDTFAISDFTLTNSSLASFKSEIHLTASNPNHKMTLSYDEIRAMMFYRSTSLAETTMTPFSQDTETDTDVAASFVAMERPVDESVVDGIKGDRIKSGNVGFNFRMVSRIRFESKAWKTRRSLMLYCGDFTVSIPINSSSGTLTGGPRQCRVGI